MTRRSATRYRDLLNRINEVDFRRGGGGIENVQTFFFVRVGKLLILTEMDGKITDQLKVPSFILYTWRRRIISQ